MAKVYGRMPVPQVNGRVVMCEWGPNYMYRIPPDDVNDTGHETLLECLNAYYDYLLSSADFVDLVHVDTGFKPAFAVNGEFKPCTHMMIFKSVDIRFPVAEDFSRETFKQQVLIPNLLKIIF